MTIAVMSDGEITPVRRSKRNADVVDVDSLEKAEKELLSRISGKLKVIFRRTYWTRSRSLLLKEDDRHMMKMGCMIIEIVAMEVFARHCWRFSNRLAF